ncbi:GIY-YIG nuclease [Prosthecochloris sp. HL-130-GSB]|nr:GIY-YIG nuclease [Prosthecochloris sp. HL-130-GSB]
MLKVAYVYILANKKNGTLYTGVTNNLERRMYEHKHHIVDGFTKKYDVTRLVWFAQGKDIRSAITLEKKIKNRSRQWKINLIEKTNPGWDDLAASWLDSGSCDYAQDDARYAVQNSEPEKEE